MVEASVFLCPVVVIYFLVIIRLHGGGWTPESAVPLRAIVNMYDKDVKTLLKNYFAALLRESKDGRLNLTYLNAEATPCQSSSRG